MQVASEIPCYATRKCCITILYLAVANTMADSMQCMMGRLGEISLIIYQLSRILIGFAFRGMV